MRFSLTSVDETDARRAFARVGPTNGQRRRPRRNFTILHATIRATKNLACVTISYDTLC
jgi:hypothetical protein